MTTSTLDLKPVAKGVVAAIALAAWAGCGGGAGEAGSEAEVADGETARGTERSGASCVADYQESSCELLTRELVRGELPDAPAEMEQERRGGSCSYSWPSDRTATREIGQGTIEYNENDRIGLSWIETYEEDAADQFRRSYLPTDEEMQRGREIMQEEYEERAQEEGLTEEQQEMGESVAEGAGRNMSFEKVDGVASNASWNAGDATLYVLDGSTTFQIEAVVSADDAANREAAVGIAEAVMEACR